VLLTSAKNGLISTITIHEVKVMDDSKRKRLEAKGWKVGSVSEFLDLAPEETALIEIKLALSRYLKERRQDAMTQAELAEKLHSSQPRVAKAENGDASVSIELLIRAMLATGVTPREIGQVIAQVG
jgi:predicted XRE-type DNA-binding protein